MFYTSVTVQTCLKQINVIRVQIKQIKLACYCKLLYFSDVEIRICARTDTLIISVENDLLIRSKRSTSPTTASQTIDYVTSDHGQQLNKTPILGARISTAVRN